METGLKNKNIVPSQNESHKARLRWRARRGLLENDLLLTRFLDAYETTLTDAEFSVFEQLLSLSDHDLMNILLERIEFDQLSTLLEPSLLSDPAFAACLNKLRTIKIGR